MAEETIIEKISASVSSITPEDIDTWVIDGLNKHFLGRATKLAYKAYGDNLNAVSRASFVEQAKKETLNATKTFFRLKRWEVGKNINSYLHLSLKRLAERVYWENSSAKRTSILVCPACRTDKQKVVLIQNDKYWRCPDCTSEVDNITNIIKSAPEEQIAGLKTKLKLRRAFALHSKSGFRCPEVECSNFIPESINGTYGIFCPHVDCSFSGNIEDLEKMSHPCAITSRKIVSLNALASKENSSSDATFQDYLEADTTSPDVMIGLNQTFKKEHEVMMDVIEKQSALIRRMNSKGTSNQKLLMYEAFHNMCNKMPIEMVSYLVHIKHNNPIQAKIFQEYISVVCEALPFEIEKNGETIEIMSATDPDLGLFYGESVFQAKVEPGGIVPNKTVETYVGGRKMKCFGPCFIGKIVDMFNMDTNEILLDKIKEYSFVRIIMDESVPVGTNVLVSHWRIPSHYELGNLVFLQRIRRLIVDRIYFRLNGVKRKIGDDE